MLPYLTFQDAELEEELRLFSCEELRVRRQSLSYQCSLLRFVYCLPDMISHLPFAWEEEVWDFGLLDSYRELATLLFYPRWWGSCFAFAKDLMDDLEGIQAPGLQEQK